MVLIKGMPVDQVAAYFQHLYGQRNALLGNEALLAYGFSGARKFLRKHYKAGIAQVLATTFALSNRWPGSPSLAEALSMKFPIDCCAYCEENPCGCWKYPKRPPFKCRPANEEQLSWGILDWAGHNDLIYGPTNRRSDPSLAKAKAINQVFGEWTEVARRMSACGKGEDLKLSPQEIIGNLRLELVDVFARTLVLANLLELDAEEQLIAAFGCLCPGCDNNPCCCPLVIERDGEALAFTGVCIPD